MSRTEILTWDWAQQPDLARLTVIVREMSGGIVHMRLAETGTDDYALVVSDTELTQADADAEYGRWWERSKMA